MSLVQTLTIVDGAGNQQQDPTIPNNLVKTGVSFSASGDTTLLAGVAAKTIKLYRVHLVAAGATSLEFKTSSSAVIDGPYPLGTNGVLDLLLSSYAWAETATADSLVINSSNAVAVTGSILTLQS